MISYVRGSLFESPAQTLVNTVNTVGVMGKGVALTFKTIYPEMFREYVELCEQGKLTIGSLFLYRTPNKLVLNFPTKEHWRNPSKPEYIEAGLKTFVEVYREAGIHSIAFPPLGCGNGELDFKRVVRPLMEEYLSSVGVPVFIYAPHPREEVAEHRLPGTLRAWLRSQPRYLSFTEVWGDLEELINRKRRYRTLSKNSEVRATFDPEAQQIWIDAAGKRFTFEKDEIRALWKELRSFGVLTTRSATKKREKEFGYLMPLLAELPYLEVIQVGETYDRFARNPHWALQVRPTKLGTARQQLELAI